MSNVTITELDDGSLRTARSGFGIVIPPEHVSALREFFAAERRMPEDVAALVARVKDWPTITRLSHRTQLELIEQLRDALEAAYPKGTE